MAITRDFLRTVDWSGTPLGPMEGWPRSLLGYVDMVLDLPTPAIVFWGPDHTQIYNDGYAVIMGPRHPRYFGATYRECWPDTYPVLAPQMKQVLEGGRFIEVGAAPITLTRHGFTEEAYFNFTFSPLRDDQGRIEGVYQPVTEITASVLRERRAGTLRELGGRNDVLAASATAFDANPRDVPFAGIYLGGRTEGDAGLRVIAAAGFASAGACAEALAEEQGAIGRVFAANEAEVKTLATVVPSRAWPEPVHAVFLVPLRRSPGDVPLGVLALGISPRLVFDDAYREFFEAAARELGAIFAAARAEEAEVEAREREREARLEAELSSENHARRLAALFEHAPVGIAVLRGRELVFEVSNPQYALLLPKRTLLQRPIRAALPELEGQGIFELLEGVFDTGQPYVGRSVRIVVDAPDGTPEERFFDFVYEPMPGEDGRTDSVIAVVFEVTELSRARREADAANRAKDEFFDILGHELRNPLAPITTALQLLRLRGEAALLKERTLIERQVEQITRLVDDLLDVSRITRGKVSLRRAPIEIASVVQMAIEMASPLLEQRHHRVQVDVPPQGLAVLGDPTRLAQVVSNLLTNAAKYTEPGGRVAVAAETKGESVAIRVEDSGIGIAPDMLGRVFDPFAQEPQALDRAQGGLGLGLTIVSNLVKLHEGAVSVASPGRGQGSTFTVELPRVDAASVASAPAAPVSKRAPAAPLKVLVVDDNEDAAEMLAAALEELGYETRVAFDGAATEKVVAEFAPDVALLDIGLPVMDGYELAARLRSTARPKPLHLVALTGYGQLSDRRRATEAGFDAHLVKPVQLDVVAELIDRYRPPA